MNGWFQLYFLTLTLFLDNNPVQNKVISDAVQPSTASPSAKPESKQMRAKLLEEQQVQCPQFNAPNLSRYHFVSSKEVSNIIYNKPNIDKFG